MIEKLIQYRISGLPVVNVRNEIIAFISNGDIMRYIGKHEVQGVYYYTFRIKGDNEDFEERERILLDLNVLEIAKRKVLTVSWDEEIENIAAIFRKKAN